MIHLVKFSRFSDPYSLCAWLFYVPNCTVGLHRLSGWFICIAVWFYQLHFVWIEHIWQHDWAEFIFLHSILCCWLLLVLFFGLCPFLVVFMVLSIQFVWSHEFIAVSLSFGVFTC